MHFTIDFTVTEGEMLKACEAASSRGCGIGHYYTHRYYNHHGDKEKANYHLKLYLNFGIDNMLFTEDKMLREQCVETMKSLLFVSNLLKTMG